MRLRNQVNKRDFVLSVDDCNRVASFITILAQINQRVRICKKDKARKNKKTKVNKSKTPLIELGPYYRGPFLFWTCFYARLSLSYLKQKTLIT